ncbi:uncharacterized protein EAE97_005506 [Botrytis byssoidea]|uniref:Homeobox domain-containing protein n=1 Tax=Botrytis byssoidea TaxID=139641 RepID=A0A9P5ITE4_9HELO|nr:uncharacterized protein EAE97_005506 [Botrytis byssoidea]KAF7944873.1 hypothetical protein EAE97_005506 [Botrytis byssoidea]
MQPLPSIKMEADPEQSLAETTARWSWSSPEEDCLTRLIKKHRKRIEGGEIHKGNLFDEVSIELNGLGFGIERTSFACASKWRRMSDNQSKLRGNTLLNGSSWDSDFDEAGDFITDEDEVDKGPNNIIDKNQKTNRIIWSEEESRTLYEEVKNFMELRTQGGLPKSTAAELFNHVAPILKVRGYVRTPRACQHYWRYTGSELWNYDERTSGDVKILEARGAKFTEPSSRINDRALKETKNSRSVLTKSQMSALSQLATESLNPSTEQKEKVAKDHGISVFQISSHFANKRSAQKKELAKNSLDHGSSKRKQFGRLYVDFADSDESIVARADDVLTDAKKPRLSSSSQIAFNNDGKSAQLPSGIEKDYIRKYSASPPLPNPTTLYTRDTDFFTYAPRKQHERYTPSSDDAAGFKEMQEMVLVQRRRIEERIAASIDRRKQLELETIRHQTRADMEREAAEETEKKVDEELKVEAQLRTRLNQIGSL